MLNLSGHYERAHYPIFLKPREGKVGSIICRIGHIFRMVPLLETLVVLAQNKNVSHFAAKILKFFFANGLYLRDPMVSQARIGQNL